MSLHAQISPEAQAKLDAQKRNSTISAIIIALLSCALIVAILFYIALSPLFKNQENLVTYASGAETEDPVTKPEMSNEVEKKPSPPSSSRAKVIAASTPSAVAVPVTEQVVTEPSLTFGDGDDFGNGWGGGGNGAGGGGGGASFFKQKVKAERICYVIDYSQSMGSKNKIGLLKKELSKSIESLPDTVDYQIIFFAGPSWVAGDSITRNKENFTVTNNGKKYDWVTRHKANGYHPKDKNNVQQATWMRSSKSQRKKSLKHIQETALVWGTVWKPPLEMALNMNPKPDVIFFMTDGMAGPQTDATAKEIGRLGKKNGVMINCVALMEPRAKDAMSGIAKKTGGVFTLVDANGETKQMK